MQKINLRTKRRKWMRDIQLSIRKKGLVDAGVCPGSSSTRATGRGSHHYCCHTAISATAHCKISAVSEGQCSGDCLSPRDGLTAVRNQWVLLWSVYW